MTLVAEARTSQPVPQAGLLVGPAREQVERPAVAPDGPLQGTRAGWLDAFRGFTMICLISRGFGFPRVKDLGGWTTAVAGQFDHTAWVGMTAWDLVQPFFMFIVGAALPFALAKRRAAGGTWAGGLPGVLKRCGLLLLWSHVLMIGTTGGVASWHWELINVLAQIAFTYLIAYLVVDAGWKVQAAAAVGLLVLHTALHVLWPGVGPGGPWARDANVGVWLDLKYLGRTWRDGYATINFVSSASATIAGVMAADLLRGPLSLGRKAGVLLAVGGGLVGLGLLLGLAPSPAAPWVPIVKKIWTASFALVSVGITLWALLAFYAVGTRWPRVPWTPLVVVGANCTFIYVVNMLFGGQLRTVVERLTGAGLAWVLTALGQPAAWTMFVVDWLSLGVLVTVAGWLYRRRIFFKL